MARHYNPAGTLATTHIIDLDKGIRFDDDDESADESDTYGHSASMASSEDAHSYDHNELVQEHLPCDAWSSTVVAIIFFFDKHKGQNKHLFHRVLYVTSPMLLYVTNIVLQISVGWVFLDRFALPKERTFHMPEFDMHNAVKCLQDAAALGASIVGPEAHNCTGQDDGQKVLAKCLHEPASNILWIYTMLLFLWYAKALKEICASTHMMHQLMSVPTRFSKDEEMIEKGVIECLDPFLKALIIALVPVPKFLIAVVLCWGGGMVLLVQEDTVHIVTKALALQLILGFDEVLTHCLETERNVKRLKHIKLQHKRFGSPAWDNWQGGIARYIVVMVMALTYSWFGCGGLNHFRRACALQAEFNGAATVW